MIRTIPRAGFAISFALLLAPGCSKKGAATKGGGDKGVQAISDGQKVGGTASGDESQASDMGATYEEVTCDDTNDGAGWCDTDVDLVFCSGGEFYVLDCSSVGDFCGEEATTIDCYAESEF